MMELICPAGTPAALKSAIDAGADAIYCGFNDETNARNFPGLNFSCDELRDSITAFARGPAERKSVGEANRARAKTDYDERAMIARYAALYAEALGRPGVFG